MPTIDLEHYQTIPFSEEQMREMTSLYSEGGKSLRELSEIYGICQHSVSRRLDTLGIKKRRKGRYVEVTQEVIDQALEFRDQGLLWKQVAARLGMNRQHLSKVIRRHLNESALPV